MDLYSKKIVGHAMSKNIDTQLAISTVENEYMTQRPTDTLVLHSDLGSQYESLEFREYISKLGIIHSFRGKGNPYDNEYIKSFYASLKKEEVNLIKYDDFNAARLAIFEYIES